MTMHSMLWLLLVALCASTVPAKGDQPVFGYLEKVLVYPGALSMQAKLDTGADNSAIHAVNIVREVRNGLDWVVFDVVTKAGVTKRFERPVVRDAQIKRPSSPPQERPVIMLEICLGTIKRKVEVGLVDRGDFDFKILIGRSFLKSHALVDSGTKFSTEPNCHQRDFGLPMPDWRKDASRP